MWELPRRWAACLPFCVLAACGGVQTLPKLAVLRSPTGTPVPLQCGGAPQPPAPGTTTRIEFSPEWTAIDAFNLGGAIESSAVPAHVIEPRWNAKLRTTFPLMQHRKDAGLVPIGGDYWSNTAYAIVPTGAGPWLSSAFLRHADGGIENRGDEPVGMLWRPVKIEGDYLRISVGGTDAEGVGVEVLAPAGDWRGCVTQPNRLRAGQHLVPSPAPYGKYESIAVARGLDQDAVTTYELATNVPGCQLRGTTVVIRAFDASQRAHVNVGSIEQASVSFGNMRPHTPLWGFADFHTHPTSNLSFGGLQGIHTIWGAPGGSIYDYAGPAKRWTVARDIPPCDDPHRRFSAHHGGYAAPLMLNFAEYASSQSLIDLGTPAISNIHSSQGGPSFYDFPDHGRGAHFEYHITQIHRAYLGGLRIMSALAVHNAGLEYGMGWVNCTEKGNPTVDTTLDMNVARAHVQAMRELESMNSDWMGIAYNPEDVRRIVGQNKLAVVLGVEVPQLGMDEKVDAEVQELEDLGIRQVVLVHGMDNLLGGTALFQDLYNSVNDWMWRDPGERDHVDELSALISLVHFDRVDAKFFQVVTTASPFLDTELPSVAWRERIRFRLGMPRRVLLSDVFPHPGGRSYTISHGNLSIAHGILHPLVDQTPLFKYPQGPYDSLSAGHRNPRGLTGRGKEYLSALMRRGMLIDMAHMSDQTAVDALEHTKQMGCEYPTMISHAHFRRLGMTTDYSDRASDLAATTATWVHEDLKSGVYPMSACVRDHSKCDPRVRDEVYRARVQAPFTGPGTIMRGNLTSEYYISTNEMARVDERDGVIGAFVGQDSVDETAAFAGLTPPPFANDCAGTSKSFATALLFARGQKHHGLGLGLASDFAMIPAAAPRFGTDACGAYIDAGSGSESALQLLETLMNPGQYRFDAQRDAVKYTAGVQTCVEEPRGPDPIACGTNAPLAPYVMGERTFDVNYDGLANYGLLPDVLQDAANVVRNGSAADVLDPLFGSAEAFVQMWERDVAADGGVPPGPPKPTHRPRKDCGMGCPSSFNQGAPLQSIGGFFGVCDVGRSVDVPTTDLQGNVSPGTPIYRQRRSDPQTEGDLSKQGDWGMYRVGANPVWRCGGGEKQKMTCPARTAFVKIRRVLDTTVGDFWEPNCNRMPIPPQDGNRAVIFECLAGPLEQ